MSDSSEYFAFHPAAYLTRERYLGLTLQQRGAFLMLECYCWINGGFPLPEEGAGLDGYKKLAVILQCTPQEAKEVWPILRAHVAANKAIPDRVSLLHVEKRRKKQETRLNIWRESGARGGHKRWRGK